MSNIAAALAGAAAVYAFVDYRTSLALSVVAGLCLALHLAGLVARGEKG